jgi:hypothetical protein
MQTLDQNVFLTFFKYIKTSIQILGLARVCTKYDKKGIR